MNPAHLFSHLPGLAATALAARRPAAEAAQEPGAFAATLGHSMDTLAQAALAGEGADRRSARALEVLREEREPAPAPAQDALTLLLAGALAAAPLRPEHAPRALAAPASGGTQAQGMSLPQLGGHQESLASPEVTLVLAGQDAKRPTPGEATSVLATAVGAEPGVSWTGTLALATAPRAPATTLNVQQELSRDLWEQGAEVSAGSPTPGVATADPRLPVGGAAPSETDTMELPPAAQADVIDLPSPSPAWVAAPAAQAGASPQLSGPVQAQVPVPVGSPEWTPAVAQRLAELGPHREIELHLHPAELGPLHVKLSLVENRAHVVFASEHAAVRQALEAGLPQLRAGFSDSGIALGQATVGSGSGQPPGQHGGHESPSRHAPPQQQTRLPAAEATRGAPSSAAVSPAAGSGRALDTFA